MSGSPKHYEPVQHSDEHNDSHEEEDFHAITIQASDDSDEKTEPTSNLRQEHHLSFDLEEEESELQRYRLSPSTSSGVSQSNGSGNLLSKKLTFSTLWQAYLDKRLEHRRRRAEVLLAMNEDSLRERLFLTLSTWTDLFDTRGVFCHFAVILLWIVACHIFQNKHLVVLGILSILIRLLWRPLWWYAWGRRLEQRKQETMAIYDQLNGITSWNNHAPEEEIQESEIV